jgi:DNA repair protein SbcC/Rad50
MIPLQLALKNFLSYQEASLDFSGLHTACICGANGAGKSSLLEAITWSIWGECRAASEDDAIANGATDMRVDFTFQLHGVIYRIIRSRQRGGSGSLELQVMSGEIFKSLTQKGVKATQALIDEYLKIDYDTFINSAYLRQGKADEFMLKKAGERKQILADLLKLDQYEDLAEQARKIASQHKAQIGIIEQQCAKDLEQLAQIPVVTNQCQVVQAEIDDLQQKQANEQTVLDTLKTTAQQRHTYQQQQLWSQQRQQELQTDLGQIQQDLAKVQLESENLAGLLAKGNSIELAYQQYQAIEIAVADWDKKFHVYQQLHNQCQAVTTQIQERRQQLQIQLTTITAQQVACQQQVQEQAAILATASDTKRAVDLLHQYQQKLQQFDRLHQQVVPLYQRQREMQNHVDQLMAQQQAKSEQLQQQIQQLQQQITQRPALIAQLQSIEQQITVLQQQRVYLDQVREQGQDRRSTIDRLQTERQGYERQLQQLQQKLSTLTDTADASCPLCNHPLSGEHWDHFLASNTADRELITQQLTLLTAEELVAANEREAFVHEYKRISAQLAGDQKLLATKGQLLAALETLASQTQQLNSLQQEHQQVLLAIEQRSYAQDFLAELQELTEHLQELNYDEQNHAVARSDVDRYRWAEFQMKQLEESTHKQQQLTQQLEQLQLKIIDYQQQIQELDQDSPLQKTLQEIQAAIVTLGYDAQQHQQAQLQLRQLPGMQAQYQAWQQAQITHPQVLARITQLQEQQHQKLASQQQAHADNARIAQLLADLPDHHDKMTELEQQLADRRQQLDRQFAILGQLTQQLEQLEKLRLSLQEQEAEIQSCRQQQLVYDELTKAFGKNGIQALIIENILPQLESEANQILRRLSNNQFHIQFITQKSTKKASRSKKNSVKNAKLIDTLDIVIGDVNGTRPYENYSGGEAFRINFSIRLALAKLLSQRAGTPLQMLIVDEGFGTQDQEGCDRLIAAINAIANDFKCILAVTHMPQFKEAFHTRIEVIKTLAGSKIEVFT